MSKTKKRWIDNAKGFLELERYLENRGRTVRSSRSNEKDEQDCSAKKTLETSNQTTTAKAEVKAKAEKQISGLKRDIAIHERAMDKLNERSNDLNQEVEYLQWMEKDPTITGETLWDCKIQAGLRLGRIDVISIRVQRSRTLLNIMRALIQQIEIDLMYALAA